MVFDRVKKLSQWEIDKLIKQLQEDKANVFNTNDNSNQVYNSFGTNLYNMQMLCK